MSVKRDSHLLSKAKSFTTLATKYPISVSSLRKKTKDIPDKLNNFFKRKTKISLKNAVSSPKINSKIISFFGAGNFDKTIKNARKNSIASSKSNRKRSGSTANLSKSRENNKSHLDIFKTDYFNRNKKSSEILKKKRCEVEILKVRVCYY